MAPGVLTEGLQGGVEWTAAVDVPALQAHGAADLEVAGGPGLDREGLVFGERAVVVAFVAGERRRVGALGGDRGRAHRAAPAAGFRLNFNSRLRITACQAWTPA